MKRILLVGPYPPPYGGIASHIVGVAPYLAQHQYAVTVLTFARGRSKTFSPAPGVEVCRVDGRRALLSPRIVPWLPRMTHGPVSAGVEWTARELVSTAVVKRAIEQSNASLVVSHMVTSSLFVPHLAGVFRGRVKFVTTIYGELVERQDLILRHREFYARVLRESDHVLATSRYCASLAGVVGFDPSRVEVIYIGVDVDRFSGLPRQGVSGALPLPEGKVPLLFVGRFHEEMGLDAVLDVIPDVTARRPDVCFVLVGASGPLSERAAEMRERYPARVLVHQDAPFSALPVYHAASRILLAPTKDRHACMGVSIKEAMAAGKAIIATNSGGVPEAVQDGRTGLLLDLDARGRLDRGRFTQAILSLLEHPERAEEMGRLARQRAAEMFDNRILLRRHLAVVERLIGDGHDRS